MGLLPGGLRLSSFLPILCPTPPCTPSGARTCTDTQVLKAGGGGLPRDGVMLWELPPPWPNLGEGTNLRKIVVRRAEPRAWHYKDGTWCEPRKRRME